MTSPATDNETAPDQTGVLGTLGVATTPANGTLRSTSTPTGQSLLTSAPSTSTLGTATTPRSISEAVTTHPRVSTPTIAILAVQGAFVEHKCKLEHLGAQCIELRCAKDLHQSFDALVLPGGESTVQGKLLRELDMEEPLRNLIAQGMPVLATCAGMILLAQNIEGEDTHWLGTIPMTVRRNAYGRQLGSFQCQGELAGLGTVPFTFIRAPFVTEAAPEVEVLARVNDAIVAVRYGNQIALAFHPELDSSNAIHQAFLDLAATNKSLNNL